MGFLPLTNFFPPGEYVNLLFFHHMINNDFGCLLIGAEEVDVWLSREIQ